MTKLAKFLVLLYLVVSLSNTCSSLRCARVRGLVVEVVTSPRAESPASPVSILHNSPFYSPVRTATATARRSPASPAPSAPFMEQVIGNVCSSDDPDDLDSEGQQEAATNDSDEGIESEDGEDIDGEAFKQLIRYLG